MENNNERPSWNDYFMELANLVKSRSTCLRRQVGCVIVKDKHVLATGYNGAPAGLAHCPDQRGGCLREQLKIPSGTRIEVCRAVHAEQNAIIQAEGSIKGASVYCTTFPCVTCAKMLINCGVKIIFYQDGYPDELSRAMLREANIITIQW